MDAHNKYRLDKNRVAILDDLFPKDITDQLIQDGILDMDDLDKIMAEKIRKDQARVLVDLIGQKDSYAYKCFRSAMVGTYDWIVQKLDDTVLQNQQPSHKVAFGKLTKYYIYGVVGIK